MNTRAKATRAKINPNSENNISENNKDKIRQYFSQHISNTKANSKEDPDTSSTDSTTTFLSSNSQIVAPTSEIELNLEENNPSDSDTKNLVGELDKKRSSSTPENRASFDISIPGTNKNNSEMGNGTDEKIDKLCDAIKLLANQVAEVKAENAKGQSDSKGGTVVDMLGSLDNGQLDKLNLKITERDAVKHHPWLIHVRLHDSKIQKIPTELSKIEDKTIRKAIYTYVRYRKEKLTDYDKMLLLTLESDPETKVSPSFLVRMINYLDEENANGEINESKFLVKVSEIDRAIHKEELENFRRQLTQSSNYSNSSKSSKPFSSWAKENKRIDKYLAWKEKYPNFKTICLDWNITGNCKRGENCGYRHECLRCFNNGDGPCDKKVRECEEL